MRPSSSMDSICAYVLLKQSLQIECNSNLMRIHFILNSVLVEFEFGFNKSKCDIYSIIYILWCVCVCAYFSIYIHI